MILRLSAKDCDIDLGANTLVFALDDTGDESLKEENGACFGIGGCAFMASDYQRLIETPWNYMLNNFFQDFKRPIHATDQFRNLKDDQINALKHFFTKFQFFRLANLVSMNTLKNIELPYAEIITGSLLSNICGIANLATFDRLFVLVESSDRIEEKIVKQLASRKIKSGNKEYDIEYALIDKAACMPAMEVADVIAHTAGGQTRLHNKPDNKETFYRKDFEDIFKKVDPRLVHFKEIYRIEDIQNA